MGAVLKGITFSDESFKSFIDFQDKLHFTIGKKRTLVAIGTHDLDTIKAPFYYREVNPDEVKFQALKTTEVMSARKVVDFFLQDQKMKDYANLLKDKKVYPMFIDSNNVVMSMPPLINSEHSKMTMNTHNIFVDITGHDRTRVMMALQTVVSCFSIYTTTPFEVETVKVYGGPMNDFNNEKYVITPDLNEQKMKCDIKYLNKCLGLELNDKDIKDLLKKMGMKYENETAIISCMRTDIMHACDIMEDVAVAYGFNNLKASDTISRTAGK